MKSCIILSDDIFDFNPENLPKVERLFEFLIEKGNVGSFFLGSTALDYDCNEILKNLQKKYTFIKRIYVRYTIKDLIEPVKKFLLNMYDETIYAKDKASMVDQCEYVVCNFDPTCYPADGEVKRLYTYAVKKQKEAYNVYEEYSPF